jgi:biotin carboxylase
MLNVCERDRIDTIFPSNDPWIYVLAKNRELFAEHGVLVPLPDYETVLKPIDKYNTVRCAQEAGFPTPRTYLPESDEDFERIVAEMPSPWMVRPRFTSGGRGMKIVTEARQLKATARATASAHGTPMIQEYIPGRGCQSFYIVLDRSGLPISVCTPKVARVSGRVLRNSTGSSFSAANAPYAAEAVRLLAQIGWWGAATMQTKTDARDGIPKLMEINPRCGTQLWTRTEIGINEPLLWLRIARGESPDPLVPGEDYPLGRLMLDPFADFMNFFVVLADLGVYRFRTKVLGRRSVDPASAPLGLAEMFRVYRDEYFGPHERVYHPSFRYLLQDPRPCLLWFTKKVQAAAVMLAEGVGR